MTVSFVRGVRVCFLGAENVASVWNHAKRSPGAGLHNTRAQCQPLPAGPSPPARMVAAASARRGAEKTGASVNANPVDSAGPKPRKKSSAGGAVRRIPIAQEAAAPGLAFPSRRVKPSNNPSSFAIRSRRCAWPISRRSMRPSRRVIKRKLNVASATVAPMIEMRIVMVSRVTAGQLPWIGRSGCRASPMGSENITLAFGHSRRLSAVYIVEVGTASQGFANRHCVRRRPDS